MILQSSVLLRVAVALGVFSPYFRFSVASFLKRKP